jgi:hypothetical protein
MAVVICRSQVEGQPAGEHRLQAGWGAAAGVLDDSQHNAWENGCHCWRQGAAVARCASRQRRPRLSSCWCPMFMQASSRGNAASALPRSSCPAARWRYIWARRGAALLRCVPNAHSANMGLQNCIGSWGFELRCRSSVTRSGLPRHQVCRTGSANIGTGAQLQQCPHCIFIARAAATSQRCAAIRMHVRSGDQACSCAAPLRSAAASQTAMRQAHRAAVIRAV